MTQQSGTQFDDDSFSSDAMDLFEFPGDEDSPIAKLKAIILSIDWEITDDILCQLDDELIDLNDIWADDKIRQVYIQGLSKIGKYIYKEKANAHPDSIRLLITFFHNLEKVVSSDGSLSEKEQKRLLMEDVAKFDQLKSQISTSSPSQELITPSPVASVSNTDEDLLQLKELKARILGIDWEINDSELQGISDEVKHLETVFSNSKAKLILLQGIGALGSYINKMRSQSNMTSFKLLRSFYDVLEKNCTSDISSADGNKLLFAEVEKFKAFKTEIAQEQVKSDSQSEKVPSTENLTSPVAPLEEDLETALPVDYEEKEKEVESDVESRLDSVFGDIDEVPNDQGTDDNLALEGVEVETEADDDSDEEALPYEDGGVAPALVEVDEESSFSVEKLAGDLAEFSQFDEPEESVTESVESLYDEDVTGEADSDFDDVTLFDEEITPALADDPDENKRVEELSVPESEDSDTADLDNRLDSFFDDEVNSSSDDWNTDQDSKPSHDDSDSKIDTDIDHADVLKGVNVETEADDDSEEEALLYEDGEIAPALAGSTDTEEFIEKLQVKDSFDIDSDDLDDNLDVLFDDDDGSIAALADGVDEEDLSTDEEILFTADDLEEETQDEVIAALSDVSDDLDTDDSLEQSVDDSLSFFDDDDVPSAYDDNEVEEPEEEFNEDALSFLDDESPAPALEDIAESALQDEIKEEDTTEVDLSFLDDEISSPELEGIVESSGDEEIKEEIEDETDEEIVDVDVSSFDDEITVPAQNNAPEAELEKSSEEVLFDDSVSTEEIENNETDSFVIEEESTQVLADEIEVAEENLVDYDDSITIDDKQNVTEVVEEKLESIESQDSEENDDIEFTVPGEVAMASAVAISSVNKAVQSDDVIEFTVPGEETTETVDSISETGHIVFEVVADDVEVDLLPGEEFADEDDIIQVVTGGEIDRAEEKQLNEKPPLNYNFLGGLIESLQKDITEDGLQAILTELNNSRHISSSTATSKIFLQLLSSVCQNMQKFPAEQNDNRLKLMTEVMSGLDLCISQEETKNQAQEKLLYCTSQILLLKTKNTPSEVPEIVEESEESNVEEVINPIDNTEESNEVSDEQLKAFVHEELADLKSTFLEEISMIRKEFVDK